MISSTRLFTYLGIRLSGDLGKYTMYTYCHKRPTFFLKSPPLVPPTLRQIRQRNRFRLVGYLWRTQSPAQRTIWELLAKHAHLRVTGYNLFLFYVLKNGYPYLETLIAQTGIDPFATA